MIKCQVFKKINNSYCACVCQTIEHQTIWDKKLIELQGGIDESSSSLQYPSVKNGPIQWAENLYRQSWTQQNHPSTGYNDIMIDCFIQQQQDMRSSWAPMEYSTRQTTFWFIKYTLTYWKKKRKKKIIQGLPPPFAKNVYNSSNALCRCPSSVTALGSYSQKRTPPRGQLSSNDWLMWGCKQGTSLKGHANSLAPFVIVWDFYG